MSEKAYKKTIDYLYNLQFFGIKLGLDRIEKMLEALGNPHKKVKIIHIAGTNGKGSVAAMISSILQEAGYKTGIYTSPHLIDFTERISVNKMQIQKEKVVELIEEIRPAIEKIAKTHSQPTFFEVVTAMALLHFVREGAEFAVLEVGLGGRLDATNVGNALVSVITNVSLDHTDILGNNITSIAKEKAGIIHENGIVVTAAEGEALDAITKKAKEKNAGLFVVGRDVKFGKVEENITGQTGNFEGLFHTHYDLKIPLPGNHQLINAATAICAVESLRHHGISIDKDSIKKGIEKTKWHGRIEILQKEPMLIIDGAHNIAAAHALKNVLEAHSKGKKIIFIMGFMSDKKFGDIVKILVPLAKEIIATKADSPRALAPEKIKKETGKYEIKTTVKQSVADALDYVENIADKNDVICITGSFFIVGEVGALLGSKSIKKGGIQ